MAVIERVDWSTLDRQVVIQQRNRETYSPVVSLFRALALDRAGIVPPLSDAARR
jgi:hypothetical protein